MDCGGLPPLCGAGRDETRPSSRAAWRTNPPRTARFSQCEGGFHVVRPWRDASHRVRWRDAFHGVPWPGWNRALHGIVAIGRGWNQALEWTMSSGEQPVRPFVEGRSGVVGPRVGCRSSTTPASGRTPNAARARKAFWAASACHSLVRREQSGRFGSWSNRAFPRGAIATGGTEAFDARAGGGPLRAADGGPLGWFICGSTSSGRTIGTRNGGSKDWAAGGVGEL